MSTATAERTETRPADPTAFQTGHIGLNVTQLERATAFYQEVFGFQLLGGGSAPERRYAFLGDSDRLVLTLWEQSAGDFSPRLPGLHHLSFQVENLDQVRAVEQRLSALGARIYHDGIVPHAEGAASGGLFFEDPDGIRLEVFVARGLEGAGPAPTTDGPTCGFF